MFRSDLTDDELRPWAEEQIRSLKAGHAKMAAQRDAANQAMYTLDNMRIEATEQRDDLTKQRDALLNVCRKLKKHSQPFMSCWEFDAFDMSVDGEHIWSEMEEAIALCPEVKERKDES